MANESDSLIARFIRSIYFDEKDFLHAVEGIRPSFGWRSLLFGRELLELGLKKKIGNGNSIHVWTELWIEGPRLNAPLMKNPIIDMNLMVKDLIDPGSRRWNERSLNEHFFQEDIDKIKKMKPVANREDFWVWSYNKSGDYSVKSGYWVINNINHMECIQAAERMPSINPMKQELESFKTSPKIKLFLWKILSEALPVVDLANRRGMNLDTRCQLCGQEGESLNHVFFSCPLTRQIWALSGVPCPENGFHDQAVLQNFSYLLKVYKNFVIPVDARKIIPWLLWYLWKNRNGFLFEGKLFSAEEVVKKAAEERDNWDLAQVLEKTEADLEEEESFNSRKTWSKPPDQWLKCNIGFSWAKKKQMVGASWVLRDQHRCVLLHSRRCFREQGSSDDAKLKVILWAVESISLHKLDHVIFALDISELVDAVNRPNVWPSFGFQVEEILRALDRLNFWRMVKEHKEANRGAALIALSVTKEDRTHSYVAASLPLWLQEVFVIESV